MSGCLEVETAVATREQAIRLLHPYEEPEIVAFPIDRGSRTYPQWIEESTK